ncbi:MAG: peptidoglycan DD-metalloendopeptidase family protein [Thermodesulfovibrionales bacterium]|nr:peptidoglycan DD-metalloendopeptidase family protein [Thermodesulfovibrionales bacterium]
MKILIILLILSISLETSAADPKEEYRKIQRDLNVHKKKLENVEKKEKSVINELNKVQAELSEIEKNLANQRKRIKNINASISSVEKDIKVYSSSLEREQTRLKKRLRAIQRQDTTKDTALLIISGSDVLQTVRAIRYLKDISNLDYKLVLAYKGSLKALAIEQTELKKLNEELKREEKKLVKIEEDLAQKKQEREKLLVDVRKEKKSFEKMIADLQDASNRMQRLIQETERRERELRQKKKAQTKQGEKEDTSDDSNFPNFKGKLPWPVEGTVITQYGSQVDPIFNLPMFRSGINIKTPAGASIKSVHEGKVVYAEEFKGYGKLVIISHGGGYHSLYGNLSRITVKNGADVKENQVVGEAGESKNIGSTGLYFEIRYKGKPLDPQQWLRKR